MPRNTSHTPANNAAENLRDNSSVSDEPVLSRRAALGAAGAIGAGALFGAASPASGAAMRSAVLSDEHLGWNPAKGEYDLPPLPYAYDALAPHIDEQTMRIHHTKHHQGYINGLNKALVKLRDIREGSGDIGLIKHWSRELSFHGSGHVNHTMFWYGMAPADNGGGGYPEGDLATRIERDFGTFEQFAAHFKAAAKAVEGSGWGWLVHEPVSGKLLSSRARSSRT
jgi:superoxide dismutase